MQKKSQIMSRATYSTGRAADLIGVGRRTALRYIKDGKFKASSGKAINADVNGSLNIGRKYLTKVGLYTEELDQQLRATMHNPRVVKTY